MRRGLALLGLLLATAVLASPALGASGRISVGLAPGSSPDVVAAAVEAATGGEVTADLGPLDALVVTVPDVAASVAAAAALPGVDYAEPVRATRRLAWQPNDLYLGDQWYVNTINAFDHWPEKPTFAAPVRVAVIDSGIDGTHPELAPRIVESQSFVGGSPLVDEFGHGTMVAGEIAAMADNVDGIAGVGIPVELLVAKVIASDGTISILAEARAIRWAVDNGAKVINLSLGGPRDPRNPFRDSYSELEHSAVDYATRKGVVVVAAGGNCFDICPDPYVGYPAALPHVVGVSAINSGGSTPEFSNRDTVYNDLAAPGVDILSTYPLSRSSPGCPRPGYTDCAVLSSHRDPDGTSFSAPLVAATAALLQAERRRRGASSLHSSQITHLIGRTAVDIGPRGRDRFSGRGRLDVDRALDALGSVLPAADRLETNDDAGARSYPLWGTKPTVRATLDRYDDVRDVYRLKLRAGQRAVFRLAGPTGTNINLALWRPGTTRITGSARRLSNRVAYASAPGSADRIVYRATREGWYFIEVRLDAGKPGLYRLFITKS